MPGDLSIPRMPRKQIEHYGILHQLPATSGHIKSKQQTFTLMVPYRTGLSPNEIGDLLSKVKVTVTENVSQNDEKINCNPFLNQSPSFDRKFFTVILTQNMIIEI